MIVTDEQIAKMKDLKAQGNSVVKISKEMGINIYTVSKHTIPDYTERINKAVREWQKRTGYISPKRRKGIVDTKSNAPEPLKEELDDNKTM